MTLRIAGLRLVLPVLLACALLPGTIHAYPTKPVTLVVGFPPGGSADILGRIIASKLSERLGQPVVVENRPGATGTVAAAGVARATPDGQTLLFAAPGHTIAPALLKLSYDPVRDFDAVAMVASLPNVLVVHPSVAATSVNDLIALAKTSPGTLNFASAGNGSINHLAGELFKSMAGVSMVHVPYKGSGAAIADLLAGRVQVAFDQIPSVIAHIRSGKLRALAVTSSQRSSALPEVPTISEAGLPGYSASSWNGVLAPAGTPKDILIRLNLELNNILQLPEVIASFAQAGADPAGGTLEEFALFIRNDVEKWARIVKTSGIRAD